MNLSTIGGNIKKYRLEAQMSQRKLAELCDISTKYVSALERSEKPPSLETLINIANALNDKLDDNIYMVQVSERGNNSNVGVGGDSVDINFMTSEKYNSTISGGEEA